MAISELGRVEIRPAISAITHHNEERIVSVTADSEGGNSTEITQELKTRIDQMNIPADYRIDFGGEQDELTEIYQDMLLKMIIGIILILLFLVIQFNSYRQVAIILFTIPLAMIGVFVGMTLARLSLDVPAFIGIVSLVGIVVNNAIILIDRINRELAKGKELVRAVSRAGYLRLRPIILTSVTTIAGLLPLSITQPDWRNMGFSIIFGLAFSTLLTLFVIPAMFVSLYKRR
jgi:multidrug efflux pump subunit AcrB